MFFELQISIKEHFNWISSFTELKDLKIIIIRKKLK